jgi:hypothetical protein
MKATAELAVHEFYVGATGRKIRVQVRDDDGNVLDQTGNTHKLSARLGTVYKIEAVTMTVEVGTDGWIYYMPSAAEVATEGEYNCQVQVTSGGLVDYTDPFILDNREPIHYSA